MSVGINQIYLSILLFAIYSFSGWIIETAYRSFTQRRFVNAGFLYGSFVPLYGFGGIFLILLEQLVHPLPLYLKLPAYGMLLTAIEYVTGFLLEKIYGLKLWDYSKNRFNIRGRVCLSFSAAWTLLALAFLQLIHPAVSKALLGIDHRYVQVLALAFLAYFIADMSISTASIRSFRTAVARLYEEYVILSSAEIRTIFDTFKRILRAFPDLNRYILDNIEHDIRNRISLSLKSLQQRLRAEFEKRKPLEREFRTIIQDIDSNEEFRRLRLYFHHNSSIYDHARRVSYLSYRISKLLKLDYRSAARGALLHDFFLYDWRNHDEPDLARDRYHGAAHPWIALRNAERNFSLNEIERDIIVKHMWPLTIIPPRYKESYVVSFADKLLSSQEFIDEFRRSKLRRRRIPRRQRSRG